MTSHDVRDVLNLPSDHSSAPRPSKKQRTAGLRPNLKGLAREVQNLGGDNPIAIVPEVSFFKKRRFASRKPAARWELKAFTNSAREDNDNLVLRHWKRKTDHAPPADAQDGEPRSAEDGVDAEKQDDRPEDSSFAKFNVAVSVPQYNDDQETDYLLELARDYDLRWPIMWDRYEFAPKPPQNDEGDTSTAVVPAPKQRTMEELKARYYEVAAKMMAVQKPAQYMTRPEFELYEMMQNFNPEQERKRKDFALNTMARSKDEAREEESLLLEIKRILARTERFNEERSELYHRLDYPATDSDIASFKSSAGLQTLLQTLMSTDKSKKRKSILGPNGEGAAPYLTPTAHPNNRRESIAAAPSHRDSESRAPATPAEPTPTTSASGTASAAANKKKSTTAAGATTTTTTASTPHQPERRKLSPHEEAVYGVSYHDRLGSGPTFRYEKINKLYSHKSGQQQLRITNALAELDVPPRLIMPTAAVTAQFEVLWGAVTALVDLRKVSDKVEAEIKLEEAKGVEEKGRLVGEKAEDEEKTGEVQPKAAAAAGSGGTGGDVGVKQEEGTMRESRRPGSSGGAAHKRSASVLSATSDKSAKRQKK
ncbi:swr complex subunit [Collariella sp. IMI 366227]|nr:swr complex subunit [Collariella sp. IMI 366227]